MSKRRIIANRFEIGDLERDMLGQGGAGNVYKGTDTQTGQTVAIKALKPGVVALDNEIVARFVREGEALHQLNHPNIVKMVAVVEEEEQHYLIIEYVGGGSLRDLLETQGPLSSERVVEIALELADALTRAHHLSIIHRDLKPANVLLAEDGTPRLTDFGLAHVADSPRLTQTGMVVGTIGYLSPEACSGERLDNRADIWALGVMLYEMLTGELPFEGEDLASTPLAILTQPVPDLAQVRADVPDALTDLIYRMLEKDRHQRIPSMRLVGAELEAILHEREMISPMPHHAPAALPAMSRFATPPHRPDASRHNLPIQPIPFVGREAELAELDRLLSDPDVRLITVLGAGGMGKTRLALEAAKTQVGRFHHGVFFVSLTSLQTVESIVPTVAKTLDFSFYAGSEPQQQLLNYLRQKSVLLIMDNFEHLLDGVGLVTDILKTAPDLRILATSRERLNVRGEQLFHLAGMDLPDWETPEGAAQYSVVKLFLAGARRVRPGFDLTADDLMHVARICRIVEGMPLGILLAAAWVEMLTPAEIATEIGKSLDFLETDVRDMPERQRSIHAVFDYSWNLLTPREQEVIQGLSVFCGGFSRQAAQRVTGASLRELMALTHKSLLHRAPTGRYEVHELLRQYTAEKLTRSPNTGAVERDQHCAYYAAALQQWGVDLKGSRQQTALAEIETDSENARTALIWAVEQGQRERLDQAIYGLCHFYLQRRRYQEGEATCLLAAEKLATTAFGDGLRVLAKILTWQSVFSERTEASQLLQQCLALLLRPELADQDTRQEKAFILQQMGDMEIDSDYEKAKQLYEQSLALYQALGDHWGTANALAALGWVAGHSGDLLEARQRGEESLTLRRAMGDRSGIADSLWLLGTAALRQEQYEEARRLIPESLAIRREIGDLVGIAHVSLDLGMTLSFLGEFAEAHSLREETLAIYIDQGVRDKTAMAHIRLAYSKQHLGQYEELRTHAQIGLSLSREIGDQRGIGLSLITLSVPAVIEEKYAEAQVLLQECVAVLQTIEGAGEMGWALAMLGYMERGQGQLAQARRHLSQALRTGTGIMSTPTSLVVLPAISLLLADQGEKERAVELYALAARYPWVNHNCFIEDLAGKHIAAVAATLPPDVVAAARERGRARDLQATLAELLVELEQ